MTATTIEDLLKQVAHKRNHEKAREAVETLGKLARRKGKNRKEALEALRQAALNCPHDWARHDAFREIGQSALLEDQEYVEFLEHHLRDDNLAPYCCPGLLCLKGQAAYSEVIDIITDRNYSFESRSDLLEQLSDHSKRPFDKAIIAVAIDEMTEEMFPVAELKAWRAAGFPDPEPIALPTKELGKLGITLPEDYAKFLLKHRSEEYDYEGDQWRLSTAEELLEEIAIDDQTLPAIRQLKAYAKTLEEFMDEEQTMDHKGKPYPLTRLAEGAAIGTSDSGDVLYLDPADQNAVWVFHHDGGDVERLSKTFKSWLRQAEQM